MARNVLADRPVRAACFGGACLTLAGCYLSHELEETTPPCAVASDCDDADPCTTSACVDGLCVQSPTPLGDARMLLLPDIAIDATPVDGAAQLLTRDGIVPFGIDGALGAPRPWPTVHSRPLDNAMAWTGTELAVLGGADDRIELAFTSGGGPEAITPGGLFVRGASHGGRLLAIAEREDTCAYGWADGRGWLSDHLQTVAGACPYAYVPDPGRGASGHPPKRRPVGFTDASATFLSMRSDATLVRFVVTPTAHSVHEIELPFIEAPYAHSFVATAAGELTGAMWVEEIADRVGTELVLAVLDPALSPVAAPIHLPAEPLVYALRMEIAFCSRRFVALWYDDDGGHVAQVGQDGALLASPIAIGTPRNAGWVTLTCVDGGVVLTGWDEAASLRCPGR